MNRRTKPPRPTKAQIDALYGTTDFKTFDDMPDYEKPKVRKPRKKRTTILTESRLQKKVVNWFGKQYPEMKDMICYNFNNSTDMISQVNNKMMGMRSGRNDLSVYYRGRALLLELKIDNGKQSDYQREFEQTAIKAGNHYRIAWTFDQATDIIRKFISWCDTQ
jgi:hypothetical protein